MMQQILSRFHLLCASHHQVATGLLRFPTQYHATGGMWPTPQVGREESPALVSSHARWCPGVAAGDRSGIHGHEWVR